jgi:hypothetical protein
MCVLAAAGRCAESAAEQKIQEALGVSKRERGKGAGKKLHQSNKTGVSVSFALMFGSRMRGECDENRQISQLDTCIFDKQFFNQFGIFLRVSLFLGSTRF